jgi:hypothetical protein
MTRPETKSSLSVVLRSGTLAAALIGGTLALGTLRDALIYAPRGADADVRTPPGAMTQTER